MLDLLKVIDNGDFHNQADHHPPIKAWFPNAIHAIDEWPQYTWVLLPDESVHILLVNIVSELGFLITICVSQKQLLDIRVSALLLPTPNKLAIGCELVQHIFAPFAIRCCNGFELCSCN